MNYTEWVRCPRCKHTWPTIELMEGHACAGLLASLLAQDRQDPTYEVEAIWTRGTK